MRRRCAAIALVLVGAAVSGSASAETPLYVQECNNQGGEFSPVEQISGCSMAIQSGRYGGKDLARVFNNRGSAFAHDGAYERAIDDFGKAIGLDPDYVIAFNNRGRAYRHKHDYDRAIHDFDRAVRLDPKDAVAFNGRGLTFAVKGETDRAIQDYDAAIRLDPSFAFAFNNRGLAYAGKGAYDRAIDDYDKAIRADPRAAVVFNNRGLAYVGKGQYNHAVNDFTRAIALNPNYAGALQERGRANFYRGAMAQALADFAHASEMAPKDAYAALWREIAAKRDNAPSHLREAAAQLDTKQWPAPVVRLYLGQATPAAVLAAADAPDAKTSRGQLCEADFYIGELALDQGARDEAKRRLHQAAAGCPKTFVEYTAAVAELKRLAP